MHHVGTFEVLEEQMTTWLPESGESPDHGWHGVGGLRAC
jgi:hypothetical protein